MSVQSDFVGALNSIAGSAIAMKIGHEKKLEKIQKQKDAMEKAKEEAEAKKEQQKRSDDLLARVKALEEANASAKPEEKQKINIYDQYGGVLNG